MICSYGILFCEKKCSGYQLMSWNPLFGMLLHRLFQQWLKWHPPKKLFSNQGWSLKGAHLPWPLSGFWKEIPLSQRIGIALCHRPLMGAFLRICWVGGDSVCWCSLINVLSIRSFPGFYVFFSPFVAKESFSIYHIVLLWLFFFRNLPRLDAFYPNTKLIWPSL